MKQLGTYRIFALLAAVAGVATAPCRAGYIAIDTFSPQTQVVQLAAAAPGSIFAYTNTTAALGGEREIFLARTNTSVTISSLVAQSLTNGINMSLGTAPFGYARVIWDGADASSNINFSGLNSYDLTQGGNDRFWLRGGADISGGRFIVTVYSSSNNYSQISLSVPATTYTNGNASSFTNFYFAFDSMADYGTGADFQDVNAIVLELNGLANAGIDLGVVRFAAIPEVHSWWLLGAAASVGVLRRRLRCRAS